MRVLVTNDDGVHASGLQALVRALDAHGHDVIVAAPLKECSGSSAAIGPLRGGSLVGYQPVQLPGLPHVPAYGIDGPPGLAVLAACAGGFGEPPAVVAAGVNAGASTGRRVLHSGTVGAALTAANLGCAGLAVSLQHGAATGWDTAAAVARSLVDWLAATREPTVLNLNVPNLPVRRLRGVRKAAALPDETVVRGGFVPQEPGPTGGADRRLRFELWDEELPTDPNSELSLLAAGFATVTELRVIAPMFTVDLDLLAALAEEELLDVLQATP